MSSQPAKRVAVSSVNWAKLAERLTTEQQNELERMKQQNFTFHSEIVQHMADPPKVDWATLKKQMPEQSAALDSLQKQWESLNIQYGNVPENLTKEVDKWTQYNQARMEFQEQKTKDGLEEVKKIEAKWAKAPPVEQMYGYMHFVQFFPHEYGGTGEKQGYADWRIHHEDGEWRYLAPGNFQNEVNTDEQSYWRRRFHDYHAYPKSPNAWDGWGVNHNAGQAKKPVWPEPLTEAGRKYVKELKERKRAEKLAGIGAGYPEHPH